MMSRNTFPEPQPDSASYTGSSANFSIISEVTCLGFHCHISHGFRAKKMLKVSPYVPIGRKKGVHHIGSSLPLTMWR